MYYMNVYMYESKVCSVLYVCTVSEDLLKEIWRCFLGPQHFQDSLVNLANCSEVG